METPVWLPLGIALGLGLLVGLQREWAKQEGAGIRTFPLVTVLGTVCGFLATAFGGWVLGAGLLAVGGLMVVMNVQRRQAEDFHPGQTTEVAALLMFGAGAMLALGQTAAAIAVGGGVAVLLQWKKPLHRFVDRIGKEEIRAVFRLVLIAMVVLPVLPDRSYGPYDVLNPFRVWLMVVLIVGISVGGYLTSRFLRAGPGSVLQGVLGGLISSTATSVSYARQSSRAPASSAVAAVVIAVASTTVFLRVAGEVAIVAPGILPQVLPQLAVMTALMAGIAGVAYLNAPAEAGALFGVALAGGSLLLWLWPSIS